MGDSMRELTAVWKKQTASSGRRRRRRIVNEDPWRPRRKTRTLATKQSPPAPFLRLGGVVIDGRDSGHGHGARGGRWTWWQRAAVTVSFGRGRERAAEEGMSTRGSERGLGVRGVSREPPEEAGKQEVA